MILSGKALMNAGIPVPYITGEYQSWQVHLIQVSIFKVGAVCLFRLRL